MRFQHNVVLLRTMFSSQAIRDKRLDEWLDGITPIGENPLKMVVKSKSRASECITLRVGSIIDTFFYNSN